MQLQTKLATMVNHTYIYKARHQKILSFRIEDDTVHIVTDLRWLKIDITKIEKELQEFLPVEEEKDDAVIDGIYLPTVHQAKENMPSLKDTILENIDKLKTNKDYVKQAAAINQSINTLINMAKLELQTVRIKSKVK